MDSTKLTSILLIILTVSTSTASPTLSNCGFNFPSNRPSCPPKPIGKPPTTVPPAIGNRPPSTGTVPCTPGGTTPPAGPGSRCPIDGLKLGACVDLLGGLVHVGLGDPVANQCCPLLQGLVELEAAVCLCTTIRLRLLNLKFYLPLALQLLITCGLTPPPGFACPNN